ncbi:MAG TPA: L-threonylcarbamoyladenylate synthase [Pyrinomonadaceae bacterium]|jgi:L-threonylcarbamoyladenylate synthase
MKIVREGPEAHSFARDTVAQGGVIAFLTDTFYGLGADPFNRHALARINQLKGRDAGKPVLVVLSDESEADRFIEKRSELFDALSAKHWPGPLTLVAAALESVPQEITAGSGTVGLRLPADERVRELVRSCGGALTATSANAAGSPPALTAAEVARYFPNLLDLIVDGGAARSSKPSTVLDTTGVGVRLIREGAVSRAQLRETLGPLGFDL